MSGRWHLPRMSAAALVVCTSATMAMGSCNRSLGPPSQDRPSLEHAYCRAAIASPGHAAAERVLERTVAIEPDYLPKVVSCENGDASLAALKAQAVAARSYLYYRLDRDGAIGDSQSDQVYSCTRPMSPLAHRAVAETSGQIVAYRGVQVAAFYVAGALQAPPGCADGRNDPTDTEQYVTYNQGKRGNRVTKTHLGWVRGDNPANRGCMSQNGADCLSDAGWSYDRILRFYYGEDIEIVQARGPCIRPVPRSRASQGDGCRIAAGRVGPIPGPCLLALALLIVMRRRSLG